MSVITLKHLGLQDYLHTYQAMQAFSAQRQPDTADEVWLVEHPPYSPKALTVKLSIFNKACVIFHWCIPTEADKLPITAQGNW